MNMSGGGQIHEQALTFIPPMRATPTATRSGATVNMSNLIITPNNNWGARFEAVSTAAGDMYALLQDIRFSAEL
jgi:hypothetical protein